MRKHIEQPGQTDQDQSRLQPVLQQAPAPEVEESELEDDEQDEQQDEESIQERA
jgi:hypothetical protein